MKAEIGILGGSGLYNLASIEDLQEIEIETPFGRPSGPFRVGRVGSTTVAFLARHGEGHTLLPGEINYRANIFGFKKLGVRRVLSASAVGSMRDRISPREIVIPDQFIDRTQGRKATFFGSGIAAHIGFADPICPTLAVLLAECAEKEGAVVHRGGTYLCMEGPAFSTRAESLLYRSWDVDVIGMTNLTEAKLAREAELCYATMALVTDFDCWHEEEENVSVDSVLEVLQVNAKLAAATLIRAVSSLSPVDGCSCSEALGCALITAPDAVSDSLRESLAPLISRYLPVRAGDDNENS